MWNEKVPLELLNKMPKNLSNDDLWEIQKAINEDKFINSMVNGRDLCGEYAPFCKGCDKNGQMPCAVAYVRMKNAQGMDFTIGQPAGESCGVQEEAVDGCADKSEEAEDSDSRPQEVNALFNRPATEAIAYEKPLQITGDRPLKIMEESQTSKQGSGKKIRIAIARRRKS